MPGLLDLLFAIIALPLQLMEAIVFGLGNLLIFDLLQLGPFLPIPSPFA